MASSSRREDIESSGSDSDDVFDEDMEALRRACMLTGKNPNDIEVSDDDSGGESSEMDDLELLRSIQERFSLPSSAVELPPIVKPLNSWLPSESDDDNDLETLRAIQRRFSQYDSDALKSSGNATKQTEMVVADVASGQETYNTSSENRSHEALSQEYPDSGFSEYHRAEDEACSVSVRPLINSRFPKAAQMLVDAIKKNRSCQKFIRSKLIQIEAMIEDNKELQSRVKCLMDYEVACKKKVGRILCQNKDPRIRLISIQKQRILKSLKTVPKKVPALSFGPAENSHVSKYYMVLRKSQASSHKLPWSTIDKEKLAKGIKQQYQEVLVLSSMESGSGLEGSTDSNVMYAPSSSDFEVTPEKIRSFLPLVNWDRLASMYLPGRSGAECEARWLNFEDPMINHNPWTLLEDKKLLDIVQKRGLCNWIDIAVTMGTQRTPFQCLARYQRSLNADILKSEWTEEEDAQLRAAVEIFGDDNWQMVTTMLQGRTGPQCSNRWRKSLHPDRRRVGRWTVDEDKRLKVSVMLFGAKNWNKIAQFSPGRTQVQCRERWLNCLDPSLNLEAWTEEEDSKLLAAIAEHGYCWSKVATFVPPRTDNQCRRRWKVLLPHEVPLLQAARQLKRIFLISNFVDRESERPSIGPDDFSYAPVLNTLAIENGSSKRIRKKRSSDVPQPNRPKKSRAKTIRSLEENSNRDGMVNSPAETSPNSSLVPYENSPAAESVSSKRIRKKTARYCENSPAAESGSSKRIRKKASSGGQKQEIQTKASCDVPRPVRRKKSTPKKRSNENKTSTVNSPGAEIVHSELSLVPELDSPAVEDRSSTRVSDVPQPVRRKTSIPKKRSNENKTSTVNSPGAEIVHSELSLVPELDSLAVEDSSTRVSDVPQPVRRKKSTPKKRSNENKTSTVNSPGAEIVHSELSLVPELDSLAVEDRSSTRVSDVPQPVHRKKSTPKKRYNENKTSTVNPPGAEIVHSELSLVPELDSPAVEDRSSKRKRNLISRGPRPKNPRKTSCDVTQPTHAKKSRANTKILPNENLMTDMVNGDNTVSKEKKSLAKLVSRRGRCNQSAENDEVLLPLDHTALDIRDTAAATSGGTSITGDVSKSSTGDVRGKEIARAMNGDNSLLDSTLQTKANRKSRCSDSEVLSQEIDSVPENNSIQNIQNKMPELGCRTDDQTRSADGSEAGPHLDHSIPQIMDTFGTILDGGKSVEPVSLTKSVSFRKLKQELRQKSLVVSNSPEKCDN